MNDLVPAVLGPVVIGAVSVLVYWDARRVGVVWPPVWALLMFVTGMLGLGLFLFVPSIPLPGLLVILLIGPIFYAFERDDTRHSGEPADPHTLADAGTTHERSAPGESDREPENGTADSSDGPNGRSGAGGTDEISQEQVDSDEYAERR
ncbi:hypothetical protein [Halostagnicola larsenii]|nr:hypothetical protein [Halostagnicola larsenii]